MADYGPYELVEYTPDFADPLRQIYLEGRRHAFSRMPADASTDVYTTYAPSGYVDYKWVVGNGELDRGVGSGSSASSMALAGAGVRCWVKNSTGNWKLTPLV